MNAKDRPGDEEHDPRIQLLLKGQTIRSLHMPTHLSCRGNGQVAEDVEHNRSTSRLRNDEHLDDSIRSRVRSSLRMISKAPGDTKEPRQRGISAESLPKRERTVGAMVSSARPSDIPEAIEPMRSRIPSGQAVWMASRCWSRRRIRHARGTKAAMAAPGKETTTSPEKDQIARNATNPEPRREQTKLVPC